MQGVAHSWSVVPVIVKLYGLCVSDESKQQQLLVWFLGVYNCIFSVFLM